ncbi:HEPN domain-containing protein [Mycolicibacter heraklionensis]|uniref:ApeA N-terminal domain 1-containing protein n=1 Tax=Mycolicibacter heraklionensis TaxID=512402 RepID=UPI001F25D013|nr:HEPN domain-containing protein [Mycolicibacter heraklionensis]
MSNNDFPSKEGSTLGQFWLPGAESRKVTGTIEVDGPRVRLEVSPGLTPFHTFEPLSSGRWAVKSTEDPPDMVVLGEIPVRPRLVTLWDAYTSHRHAVGLPSPFDTDSMPTVHEMKATWCLVGGHLADPESRLFGVRPDVTNLAEWAWQPTVTQTIYLNNRLRQDWHLDLADKSLDTELVDGAGYITLGPAASLSPPGIRGFAVKTSSQLEIELVNGWTMPEVVTRALQPLADLMTILSGASCVVRSLDVWAGEWCSVHGYQIDPDGPATVGELLFVQPQVGLDFLARWLDVHYRTTPVPQILAAVMRNEFPTVEAQALSLATAVEALHRTLFPHARRFSVESIDESLESLAVSGIPGPVAETFASALRQYWHEYSYPQRVRALAEPVSAAVPECVGRLGRWKNAVVEQRIALAHGMESGRLETDQILRMSTLNRSLQWMLALRLLLEAGVPAATLAEATAQSERFGEDKAQWTRHWPRVFINQTAK